MSSWNFDVAALKAAAAAQGEEDRLPAITEGGRAGRAGAGRPPALCPGGLGLQRPGVA